MKKILSITLVLIMSLAVFTGCEDNIPKQRTPKAKENITDTKPLDSGAQSIPDSSAQLPSGEQINPQPKPQNTKPQNTNPQNTNPQDGRIGIDAAKDIALKRAGLTADNVVFEKAQLDFDDGIWKYEIEFRVQRTEYDVDIKADDGKILSFEKDIDD